MPSALCMYTHVCACGCVYVHLCACECIYDCAWEREYVPLHGYLYVHACIGVNVGL